VDGLSKRDFYDPAKVAMMAMGFCYPGKVRTETCLRAPNARLDGMSGSWRCCPPIA